MPQTDSCLLLTDLCILFLCFCPIHVYFIYGSNPPMYTLSCEVSMKVFSGDFLRLFPDYSIRVTKYTKVLEVGKQKSI